MSSTDTNTTATTDTLYWVSADGQREIDMSGATEEEALRVLLEQCATAAERAAILAGSFCE